MFFGPARVVEDHEASLGLYPIVAFAVQLNHFIPYVLSYSVAAFPELTVGFIPRQAARPAACSPTSATGCRPRRPPAVRRGARDRARPTLMGLACLGLEIRVFCDPLCSVLLLNAILGLAF